MAVRPSASERAPVRDLLSGGSTPKRLYEWLAEPAMAARFPWNRVHWFWGDERFVPHDHPDSNYRMTREALLARVPAPADNIHPVPTEGLSPEQAAAAYEATLKAFYGADAFDRPAAVRRQSARDRRGRPHRLAVSGPSGAAGTRALGGRRHRGEIRGSHHPHLSGARQQPRAVFLATGEDKRAIVARAQAGDRALPSAGIHPVGQLHWFTDRAATPTGA